MKKYCQANNVDIFSKNDNNKNDNNKNDNNKNDNNKSNITTIENYYWGPNIMIIKMIEQLCMDNEYKKT